MKEDELQKGVFRFPKEERLHHRSLVEGLFRRGKSFYEFPFRVTWRAMTETELQENFRNNIPDGIGRLQMLVTVPKKKRKKAVDRVCMRRRIRESYRLNKNDLKKAFKDNHSIRTLSIALVYIHDKNLPYFTIEEKVKTVIARIQSKLVQSEIK